MRSILSNDTICAIATPPGHGGIGIVRISGPAALHVFSKIWQGSGDVRDFEPRRLYLGKASNDKVLAVFLKAPATYTGEDVVEISAHGSPMVLKRILNACIEAGARIAEPGEFTRRAFLAGKMDLVQAEAVADLINAASEKAANLAALQLSGRLSDEIKKIGEDLADLRAITEASIDFPEDDIEHGEVDELTSQLDAILSKIEKLSSTFGEGRLISEGVRVAIVGKPNVGKSSILNFLAGHERAIVHHEPGTTRDVVEEIVVFGGVSFKLRDTAGVRGDALEVEAMGIERSHREIAAADFVIAVFDSSRPFDEADASVLRLLQNKKVFAIINKTDLPRVFDVARVSQLSSIEVSAKTGQKMEQITERLVSIFDSVKVSSDEGAVITNSRHKNLLNEAQEALRKANESVLANESAEFIACNFKTAQDALGQITGEVTTDDILDRIFYRFCIGK